MQCMRIVICAMIVAVALVGCNDASQSPRTSAAKTTKGRTTSREQLIARINELGGQDAYPVVPLDAFFAENHDEASFAPNLDPHPSIAKIAGVLHAIEQRPDVSAVVVQIDEVLDPPEWPYASLVYVVTDADAKDVHEWAASIEPDELSPGMSDNYGWGQYAGRNRDTPPPGAPEVPPGYRPVVLSWD
jgi:hypothetical protein